MKKQNASNSFANKLLSWFTKQRRDFPWRRTRDPYHTLVAEVMLQQTRAATVIPYFNRFIGRFPTVESLAAAAEGDMMKTWEGLGYYARARNLQRAARMIVRDLSGRIPKTRAELLKIPGIGPYTSASVASIAFGEDCAAVDGNVMRVLSRLYLIASDLRAPATRNQMQRLADSLLPPGRAGAFNEAMMELGATVCTPKNPNCPACPVRAHCLAYKEGRVSEFPFRSKSKPLPHHQIAVGVVHKNGKVLIALRPAEGLLGNLWEFPGGKLRPGETLTQCCEREIKEETGLDVRALDEFSTVRHSYTHFRITLHAFHCEPIRGRARPRTSQEVRWVKLEELEQYAFPRANKRIFAALDLKHRLKSPPD